LHSQQTVKFEQYAYLFSSPSQLSESIAAYAMKKPPKAFISKLIQKRAAGRTSFAEKYPSYTAFCHHYEIDPKAENDTDFAAKWETVNQYIKGMESIARDMLGDKEALPWLFKILQTPDNIKLNIIRDIAELKSGGVSDHCLIIAYHYLISQTYSNKLSAHAVEIGDILIQLQAQLLPHIQMLVNEDARNVIDRELALTQDLRNYLAESVFCSHPAFSSFEHNPGKVFTEYQRRRTGGAHLRLCVICGRTIPAEMKVPTIKTGIIEDQALVFSNKLVPRVKVAPQMVWCPMCYLEFTLRNLTGLGYPPGVTNSLSDRLYIYLFPDYFFTPEQVKMMKKVFDMFTDQTILKLRRYGKDDTVSLPSLWIRENHLDVKMQGQL
jgi:CRISPR type I-D-associated protein Csc3/Cas10d